jgi:hypothetical protein
MDWLLKAMEDHTISPEQLKVILEENSKRDRKFREEMRAFDAPIQPLISGLDLMHLPEIYESLIKKTDEQA